VYINVNVHAAPSNKFDKFVMKLISEMLVRRTVYENPISLVI